MPNLRPQELFVVFTIFVLFVVFTALIVWFAVLVANRLGQAVGPAAAAPPPPPGRAAPAGDRSCAQCGAPVAVDDLFCRSCGAALT